MGQICQEMHEIAPKREAGRGQYFRANEDKAFRVTVHFQRTEVQNETETSGTIVLLKGSVRVHRKFSCDLKINNSHGKFWWEKL